MNAIAKAEPAATVSAEIEAIFVGTRPASLDRAIAAAAELRDEMERLNELLAPDRKAAWRAGERLPSSSEAPLEACRAKLVAARRKLDQERTAYAPNLQEAIRPARRKAGKFIAEALLPIENAIAILTEINRRAVMSGIIMPDSSALNLSYLRDALREAARQCGVQAA